MPNERPSRIEKLVIAVSFHYVESRLQYLHKISSTFRSLGDDVFAYIVTQTKEDGQRQKIVDAMADSGIAFKIVSPSLLGHPYLLTWTHLEVFRQVFGQQRSVTHFLYLEDDILVRPENIRYWLKGREDLREIGLIPSFLRYELKGNTGPAYSSDITIKVNPAKESYVLVDDNTYAYFNLTQPYQGMYLLDRELAYEHLFGPSNSPDSHRFWNIREKAAQGLTFANVPVGFQFRNAIGYRIPEGRIDEYSLVHHTPNNYAEGDEPQIGKMLVTDIVSPRFVPQI